MKKNNLLLFVLLIGINAIATATTLKGKVTSNGSTISSVQITDGKTIVLSDKNGKFTLEASPESEYIYYSLPSGYESPIVNGIPVFFEKINQSLKTQKINFEILKSEKSQSKHAFILWADPQVLDVEEFDQLEEVVADVNKTIASFPKELPVHAISAGDNVFDRLNFFDQYKQVISQIKVPFYHVIGNHDMDYNNRSNELSTKSFSAAFGPTHFSFNVGKIHYIVLKDVFYYGFSYRYIGYIDENQLQWLEQDLKSVQPGSTVIVTLHIPTIYGESQKPGSFATEMSNSVLNRQALYKILSPFNTHILAGHSHTQWLTQATPNITEHVHAAASGAWWQGEICTDGSPKAYTVYEVNGDSLSWFFKGVNQNKSEQFKLYKKGTDTAFPDYFTANVYNYDTLWKVRWYEDEVLKGEMQRYWGVDPAAAELYQPGKNKKHSWLSVSQTQHLFRAQPVNPNAKIRVEVLDRFGNIYHKMLE
ncbi:MAG TPA: calcineurin-like phosphoesterase family protein [Paludibacter sp.]|nr:calcineurin-like phosphoesterase family protein [Paludibacter sp.]